MSSSIYSTVKCKFQKPVGDTTVVTIVHYIMVLIKCFSTLFKCSETFLTTRLILPFKWV